MTNFSFFHFWGENSQKSIFRTTVDQTELMSLIVRKDQEMQKKLVGMKFEVMQAEFELKNTNRINVNALLFFA